ncbi:MAG: N-acetylmuramoyl-L-alanine amidase [Eubacteriales bacterium]|nr:N-acetylmuramoyl-L-alanine amidase [Eubacteriales bacterium]
MKKMIGFAALAFAVAFAGTAAVPVRAELTVEEQEAAKQKKAEEAARQSEAAKAAAKEAQTETEADGPVVAIDPGHQTPGLSEGVEPVAPGSETMKARVAVGTSGSFTGLGEYELNLQVSLKLRDELENRGYRVVMTRETNDVDISNMERSQLAQEAGAEILVRIHANGSDDSSVSGALMVVPSEQNPYTADIYSECIRLSGDILNAYCEKTGMINCDFWVTDDMTGINWSEIPVTILEMGFMTNEGDDYYMADESNQYIMAEGIADGIDAYFGRQ